VGVSPIRLDAGFFCRTCGALASPRTCPHDASERLELSGTRVRELLRQGQPLPAEFTRPEVAEVLRAHYAKEAPPVGPGGGSAPASGPIRGTARVAAAAPGLHPLFLKVSGRRVLLVGGGRVAATRAEPLLAAGADLVVVAPEVRPELDRADLRVERRAFRPEDVDGAWLVVAAATPEVNRDVRAAADARRVFVNATDDPEAASAYAGGVLTRGGITIAISSQGEAPALAGLLREALDALLPEDLERWVDTARSERRAWKERGVPMARRRPLLLEALNTLYREARA
jgi:siroheme synthase-like protein